MKQSLRILRGTDDDVLHYVYEVDLPSGSSVLDALEYIRTGSVPDLMYRISMITQQEMRPLPLYTGAALVYFAIVLVAGTALRAVAERWRAKIA